MAGLGGSPSDASKDGRDPDGLLAELARWSAHDKAARAASERSRTRSLVQQSAAAATWTGVLVDLAEGQTEVTVWLGAGAKLAGCLVGVGRDFVVLERGAGGRAGGGPVLVRSDAVAALVPTPSPGAIRRGPGGERPAPLELTLAGALDALAGEEAPVTVRAGTDAIAGSLVASGEDVLTLRPGGVGAAGGAGAGRLVYVPVRAVTWVELR